MPTPHPALIRLARGEPLAESAIQLDDDLLASAREHRMEGLLWSAVRHRASADADDRSRRMRLVAIDLANRTRNQRHWEGLAAVATVSEELGVDVATFKGVTAEARWYDRPGERPCGDIDLWLAPHDRGAAGLLISRLQPNHPLLDHIDGLVADDILESVELRTETGTAIDLHFEPLKLGVPDREKGYLWQHIAAGRFATGTFLVPGPELSLLQHLTHLNKDRFRRLIGFVDVARLLHREDVDWDGFARIVAGQGLEDVTTLALSAVDAVVSLPGVPALPRPRAWVKRVWAGAWRPSVRLLGTEGATRFRRRQDLLPFLERGRVREAGSLWLRRRVAPPRRLLEYRGAGPGPYPWLVTGDRLLRASRRRRERRRSARL